MKLFELFNDVYEYEVIRKGKYAQSYDFELDDGGKIGVEVMVEEFILNDEDILTQAEIIFDRQKKDGGVSVGKGQNNSLAMTGDGDSLKILATVMKIIENEIAGTADFMEIGAFTHEKSKVRVYERLLKRSGFQILKKTYKDAFTVWWFCEQGALTQQQIGEFNET